MVKKTYQKSFLAFYVKRGRQKKKKKNNSEKRSDIDKILRRYQTLKMYLFSEATKLGGKY